METLQIAIETSHPKLVQSWLDRLSIPYRAPPWPKDPLHPTAPELHAMHHYYQRLEDDPTHPATASFEPHVNLWLTSPYSLEHVWSYSPMSSSWKPDYILAVLPAAEMPPPWDRVFNPIYTRIPLYRIQQSWPFFAHNLRFALREVKMMHMDYRKSVSKIPLE